MLSSVSQCQLSGCRWSSHLFHYVYAEKFCDLQKHLELRILRIYSKAVENKDYPRPNKFSASTDAICAEWARPYALHHMIRDPSRKDKNLREMDEKLKEIMQQKSVAAGKFCLEYEQAIADAQEDFLGGKFDIVFCTCNETASARVRKKLKVSHCIIDECGMAQEPETIIPISLCEHVVLIGDHKQLQPVINCKAARECGLSTSLFERYAESSRTLTLKTQYRMVS